MKLARQKMEASSGGCSSIGTKLGCFKSDQVVVLRNTVAASWHPHMPCQEQDRALGQCQQKQDPSSICSPSTVVLQQGNAMRGSWGNQARVSARKCCRRKEKRGKRGNREARPRIFGGFRRGQRRSSFLSLSRRRLCSGE